jgi:hypothetical protein
VHTQGMHACVLQGKHNDTLTNRSVRLPETASQLCVIGLLACASAVRMSLELPTCKDSSMRHGRQAH